MAGIQLTEAEILALLNEGRPAGVTAFTSATLVNDIYGGATLTAAAVTNAQLVELINAAINNDNVVASVARIIGIRTNEAIVSLVNSHNPYTSDDMMDMTIYTGNPDFEKWADNKSSQMEVEVDGPYTMPKEWYFKGLPQQISKALRIKYRYRAKDLGKPGSPPLKLPHWVTAYMLIGYEDGGA
jgi:hypothetical protein